MTGCWNGLNSGADSCRNGIIGTQPPISISVAVITACTPGRARAAFFSMARMRPCATGLRTMTAWSVCSNTRSSMYWPRPVRKRKSSRRSTGLPTRALVARLRFISDHDGGLFVADGPRHAERRQGRGLRIGARGLALKLNGKATSRALDLNLVHVARRCRIGDELDLRALEAEARNRDCRRDIGVLRIKQCGFPCAAAVEHRGLGKHGQVNQLFRRRSPPGQRRLARAVTHKA